MLTFSLALTFSLLLQEGPPPPVSLEAASISLLEAFDANPSAQSLPSIPVSPADRPAHQWLLAALSKDQPSSPFPKHSIDHQEAARLLALFDGPQDERGARLKVLSLRLAGTQAALWRWGQRLAHRGEMPTPLRRQWEDRLLRKDCLPVIRGWAIRHALCFALAEDDESRLETLIEACSKEVPDLIQQFQRAFALLGGPPPRVYLWSLPELEPLDRPLGAFGSCIRISPLEPGSSPPPESCSWIIPAMNSDLPANLSALEGPSLEEAKRLADQVRSMGRKAYLAPSREPLMNYALAFFPIEIHLDARGFVQSIRMGDAAQAKPTP